MDTGNSAQKDPTAVKTVFIVEDDEAIGELLVQAIEQETSYQAVLASDGFQALKMLRTVKPDLLILDYGLPDMNGLELCRRLRSISDVPIIVLSVRGEEKTKVEALDAGADDYVTKPFGMNELFARIRATLRRQPV